MANILSSDLAIFLVGTLAAAFVTGLAGFAFGIVAAGVWLFALTPSQTSALIVAYGLLVQGYAVWKLRYAIRLHRLAPFIVGSAIGIPAGIAALRWISPAHFRIGVGVLLIVFSLYNLVRPKLPQMKAAGRSADAAVGFSMARSAARPGWPASFRQYGAACVAGRVMSKEPSFSQLRSQLF